MNTLLMRSFCLFGRDVSGGARRNGTNGNRSHRERRQQLPVDAR